jgi:hypothetical protein
MRPSTIVIRLHCKIAQNFLPIDCRMNLGWLLTILFVALCGQQAAGADLGGRYQGYVQGVRKSGAQARHDVFLIIRSKGNSVECSASLRSFDDQHPCKDVAWSNGVLSAVIPDWGDVSFALKLNEDRLTGPLTSSSGQPSDPYQSMEVSRVGDLELTDLVPRLEGEGAARSPRLRRCAQILRKATLKRLGDFGARSQNRELR